MRIAGRLALVVSILAAALSLTACMGTDAAQQRAGDELAGVIEEAKFTAGPGYRTSASLVKVKRIAADLPLLSAYEAEYSVSIVSTEYPSFEQVTSSARYFGPGAEPRAGGLHDWGLFRELATWDAPRRRAFLEYVAAEGNPLVDLVSVLDESFGGAWWSESTPSRAKLLAIGKDHGLSPLDLAVVTTDDRATLIGYDAAAARWTALADRQPGESGPIVER